MPKPLFYAGVVVCALLALCSASQFAHAVPLNAIITDTFSPAAGTGNAFLLLLIVFLLLPVAAIFLRMATLLAARNLFGAIFATFSIACTAASFTLVATVHLRLLYLLRAGSGSVMAPLRETELAGYYAFGWFLSVTLLSLRPYFKFQASRVLTVLLCLPLPVFAWFMAGDLRLFAPGASLPSLGTASLIYWVLLSTLFFAISGHCLRHRHMFIEITNLRQLLDSPLDPAHTPPRRLSYGGIAFDS
ncbi:MAG: hypothetical protein ABI718_00410 [Acidobacteriota bacterium]